MSGLLAGAGMLVAAAGAAAAILLPPGRRRSAAMLVALILSPFLIFADQWHSPQILALRHDTARLAALVAAAVLLAVLAAAVFRRWPVTMPLAIVAALPFRIPLHAGGESANLLVPLYLVIAGGVLSVALRDWSAGQRRGAPAPAERAAAWLPRVLGAVVLLYAAQGLYSADFSKGLQNLCFFVVPFSLVYGLLRDVEWDRRLLLLALLVVSLETVAFVVVGSVEYLSRSLFWNPQVIRSNEFHVYFRVNSIFWDPNIYGRWLALTIVIATAALLWARERRSLALLTALVFLLWIGLAPTFSQSSFVALLAGLAVLAALRWSLRWTLASVGVLAVGAVLVVLLVGGAKVTFPRFNVDTSGRADLISGGARLFAQRPIYGYGSGSFPKAYKEHENRKRNAPVSVSHTEPITVAAEQGLIGLIAYVALLGTALWTLAGGLRRQLPGRVPWPAAGPAHLAVGRAALLAAFVALLVHTMAYAGFFEDPITWVLLAVGASLAAIGDVPAVDPRQRWSTAGTSHPRA